MHLHAKRSLRLVAFLATAWLAPGVACAKTGSDSKPPPPAAPTAPAGPAEKPPQPPVPPPATSALQCPADMALLPAGSFVLGATRRKVKVEAFCIDKTEVSAADYQFCVDVNRCSSEGLYEGSWATYIHYPGHPINYVTWAQADHYCDVHLKRLPTEEQWEWAARGGPAGNTYPWGNNPPSYEPCWSGPGNDSGKDKREQTCPAGSHALDVTPQGVLDMAGSVYEWTATRGGKGERIIRSAAWNSRSASSVEASSREPATETERSFSQGFRCVQPPTPADP